MKTVNRKDLASLKLLRARLNNTRVLTNATNGTSWLTSTDPCCPIKGKDDAARADQTDPAGRQSLTAEKPTFGSTEADPLLTSRSPDS